MKRTPHDGCWGDTQLWGHPALGTPPPPQPGVLLGALSHGQGPSQGRLHLVDQRHLRVRPAAGGGQAGQEEARQGRRVFVLRVLRVGQQVVQHEGQDAAVLWGGGNGTMGDGGPDPPTPTSPQSGFGRRGGEKEGGWHYRWWWW